MQLAELLGGDVGLVFFGRVDDRGRGRLGLRLGFQLGAEALDLFAKAGQGPLQ
ncbi:hypothetical protein D3C85_1747260 [compost metagenome]